MLKPRQGDLLLLQAVFGLGNSLMKRRDDLPFLLRFEIKGQYRDLVMNIIVVVTFIVGCAVDFFGL
jgi:hypothetical protein